MALRSVPTRITQPECCSFCGKTQRDVEHLLNGVSAKICCECVAACVVELREVGWSLPGEMPAAMEAIDA